jgi:hypothetical protein
MEMVFLVRYLFQAAFAFMTALSVFLSAPAFLEKKTDAFNAGHIAEAGNLTLEDSDEGS